MTSEQKSSLLASGDLSKRSSPAFADFPKSRQSVITIEGKRTEIALSDLGNTMLVILTQNEKVGTFIHAARDSRHADGERTTFEIRSLLGQATDVERILARQLISHVNTLRMEGVAVLLMLGLPKEIGTDYIAPLVKEVVRLKDSLGIRPSGF